MVNNIMSYSRYACNSIAFTKNQYDRIKTGLESRQIYKTFYDIEACQPESNVAVPSNVKVGTGGVVTWSDNSNNETGFLIDRSTLPTFGFVSLGGVGLNVTTFTDTTIVAGIIYYYRIRPSNSLNYSDNSSANSDCPNNLSFATPYTTKEVIKATSSITSTSNISGSSASVEFKAGQFILLNDGFIAQNGVNFFEAKIEDCVSSGGKEAIASKVAVENEVVVEPTSEFMLKVFPNPINNGVFNIAYELPKATNVNLSMLNILGVSIVQFIKNKYQEAGQYVISYDSPSLTAGIYFLKLFTDEKSATTKVLIKD